MNVLQMTKIAKSFNGAVVLKDVNFDVQPGEVHALIGENGAGKSTLIKIASGVYQKDAGQVTLDGEAIEIRNPADAHRAGIFTVHQEPSMMPNLSAAENVFMGFHPCRQLGIKWVDKRAMERQAAQVFARLGMEIDVRRRTGSFSIAQQQMVEIAKALVHKARILILDEPTATLSSHETEILFGIVRQLRDGGTGIVFVSHRLSEVLAISDRVTVLRDGGLVGTCATATLSEESLVRMMVGRELQLNRFEIRPTDRCRPLLSVSGLTKMPWFYNVSFDLYPGEVLGMAGLVGSGRTNVAEAIFGIRPADSGQISIDSRGVRIRNVKEAIRQGIVYIPEDRHKHGVALPMSIATNITLVNIPTGRWLGCIDREREACSSLDAVRKLNIKTQSVNQPVQELSGGNQQKVVLAKWLNTGPRIVILDEPTRGVDVGSKREIHVIIDTLAREGNAVLLISSDLPEILTLADRTLVMHEGRLVGQVERDAMSEESIMTYATGSAASAL